MACSWSLEKTDAGDVFVLISGLRAKNQRLEEFESVDTVRPGDNRFHLRFKFKNSATGRKLDRTKLQPIDEFNSALAACETNSEFIALLTNSTNVSRNASSTSPSSRTAPDTAENMALDIRSTDSRVMRLLPEDEDIQSHRVGRFTVSVSSLHCPPPKYLCRPIVDSWVQHIRKSVEACPFPHVTVLPGLVDPAQLDNKDNFKEEDLSAYAIYTLGGNHFRTAIQALLTDVESVSESLKYVAVDLYVGLSTQQARRVGNLHNKQTESSRLSFIDEARQARRILYEMLGRDMERDEPDHIAPDGYRAQCLHELASENMGLAALKVTFHVAKYSRRCWTAVEKISRADLASDVKETNLKKEVFRSFIGVSESDTFALLTKVVNGEMSLRGASEKSKVNKKMDLIRNTFLNVTGIDSWSDAVERYPEATSDEKLRHFLRSFPKGMQSGTKCIPKQFISFCRRTVDNRGADRWNVAITVQHNDSVCCRPEVMGLVEEFKQKLIERLQDLPLDETPVTDTDISQPTVSDMQMSDDDDYLLASLC